MYLYALYKGGEGVTHYEEVWRSSDVPYSCHPGNTFCRSILRNNLCGNVWSFFSHLLRRSFGSESSSSFLDCDTNLRAHGLKKFFSSKVLY